MGHPVILSPAKDSGKTKLDPVVREYLHHLRYPELALNANQEQTIWFTASIGPKGELLDFRTYEQEPDQKGRTIYTIRVTSLPKKFPTSDGETLTKENFKAVFIKEARTASEKMQALGADKNYAPGEYWIKVIFHLEKAPGTTDSMGFSIEGAKKGSTDR